MKIHEYETLTFFFSHKAMQCLYDDRESHE